MLKRLMAVAVMVCMCLGCYGCGDKKEADNRTEIRIWTNNSHSKEVVTKLAEKWNETTGKEKGIKIKYEVREGDPGQDVDVALAAGNAPEMFAYLSLSHIADGKILALDDIEGGKELMAKYPKELLSGYTFGGKTYCVPFSASTRGLVYNKDMFKKAGIVDENGEPTPPETWDEVVEYAKKLTNPDKGEYGIIFPMKWGTWVTSDMLSPGFSSIGFDGYNPVTGKYDYTGYEPIFNAIMQMKKDNSYFPGAEGLDNDPARAKFSEGVIGMKFAFSWDVGVFNDQFPAKCDWGVAEYPVVDKDNKYMSLMSINGDMVINKEAAEKVGVDKVFEVYKWWYSPEVITELYKNCYEIPVMSDMILDDELYSDKKGWKEFCALADISTPRPKGMPADLSGKEDIVSMFVNKVWPGEAKPATVLKEYTKIVNEGVEKYKKLHPEEDYEQYINKDWNIKR